MTVQELINFLETVEDKDHKVEIMNVYGDLGGIEHIQEEDGKIVMY